MTKAEMPRSTTDGPLSFNAEDNIDLPYTPDKPDNSNHSINSPLRDLLPLYRQE